MPDQDLRRPEVCRNVVPLAMVSICISLIGQQTAFDSALTYGGCNQRRAVTGRPIRSSAGRGTRGHAAIYEAEAGLREAEFYNRQQGRSHANAALRLAVNGDRDIQSIVSLTLARSGDSAQAEKFAAELNDKFPQDTLVQSYWLPTIKAAIQLERRNPGPAIELLELTSNYELGTVNTAVNLTPVYVRGQAYLMLRNGSAAAAEFQKVLDHRGIVLNSPLGALARLGLARAYALQGDTAKARAAYQDFLTLWKDADPDIPILRQAKAEYTKLK